MDDPGIAPAEHVRALSGLARLNRWSRSASHLWRCLMRVRPAGKGAPGSSDHGPWKILDIATGSGDLPLALWRRSRRRRLSMQIDGVDSSALALTIAKQRALQAGSCSQFFQLDVLRAAIPDGYDVATISLFTHHLQDEEIVDLLTRLAESCRVVIINDLRRSPVSMFWAWLGAHVLTRSRVVHVDSIRSIRAAMTPGEFLNLAVRAGMKGGQVRKAFPARFTFTWVRR